MGALAAGTILINTLRCNLHHCHTICTETSHIIATRQRTWLSMMSLSPSPSARRPRRRHRRCIPGPRNRRCEISSTMNTIPTLTWLIVDAPCIAYCPPPHLTRDMMSSPYITPPGLSSSSRCSLASIAPPRGPFQSPLRTVSQRLRTSSLSCA